MPLVPEKFTAFLEIDMSKRLLLLVALLIGVQSPSWAEPTMDQVYNAARNGQMDEARSMMQEVLRAHPNSAKAHFVDAEVLARSGDLNAARDELAMAEKLQPGLPFANPSAVQELRQELSGRNLPVANEAAGHSGLSWGWILVLGGLGLLFVIWMVRRQAQRPVVYTQMPPSGGGYYPPGGVPGGQPMAPMGGGGGSGILGTLATGAALGAGMVAGEALAHRLVDGGGQSSSSEGYVEPPMGGAGSNSDMGGQDFGVSDSGSWDDSSGSWDSSGGDSGSDWS